MPNGYDLESLAEYLTQSRESYTMMGLHLRVKQDKGMVYFYCLVNLFFLSQNKHL